MLSTVNLLLFERCVGYFSRLNSLLLVVWQSKNQLTDFVSVK